jgi:hypothetical protein
MPFLKVLVQTSTTLPLQIEQSPAILAEATSRLLVGIILEEFEKCSKIFEKKEVSPIELQFHAIRVSEALDSIALRSQLRLSEALTKAGFPDIEAGVSWEDAETFVGTLSCSPKFVPISTLYH